MRPRRLSVQSLGGAIVTSVIAAAWLAPGAAFASPGTEILSVTGTVLSVIADPEHEAADSHTTRELAMVRVGDLLLPVPPGSLAGADSGQKATVKLRVRPGTSRAAALADAAGTTPAGAPGASSAAVVDATLTGSVQAASTQAVTLGAHSLTVLPVFWSVKDNETQASLTTLANQAKSYWAEQSGGRIDIGVDVRDWKQATVPTGTCNYTGIYQAALAAHGVSAPASANEHVAVYFPKQADCSWAGLGSVNGPIIWINGYPWEDVLTHEFGHNLGLGHANKATCTASGARVSLSTTCTVSQYEDVTDVMGYAMRGLRSGNLNAAFGDYLGLQQTVTASPSEKTTVDLSALSAHSGTGGLKIATSAGTVFVDFRPATGRDTRAPYWAGVQVRLRTTANPPATQLLDMQPGTATPFSAANLPVGGTWQIPGGQTLKVTAAGANTATVEVSTATSTDTTVPSVAPVITTAAAVTKDAGQTVTWSAAEDKESRITGYRVLVNGATAAETGGDTLTAQVPLSEGGNTVAVVAVNGAGLVRNSTTKIFTRDSIAPDAVTGLKVGADGRSVSWAASTTDKGTARSYAVRVDGTLVTTVSTTTATLTIASGQRTVSVTASDAAGNVGAATETRVWIDPAAPSGPVVTSPAPGAWHNSRQVNVTWNAASAPGSGIRSYTVTVNGRATTVSGDATSATVTVPTDGVHRVSVTAKSMSGLVSLPATATVQVDTLAPEAAKGVRMSADQSRLTWAAVAGKGAPVSWKVQFGGGTPVTVTRAEAPNTAADGKHTWTIAPVDAAGNAGPATEFTAWTDRTAPSQPVITSPAADSFTKAGPVTVTWEAATDADSEITVYLVTAGSQKVTVPGTSTSLSYKPVDGRQTVTVTAVNGAGLRSAAATAAFTHDQTAPIPAAQVTVNGSGTALAWKAATDRVSGVAEYVLYLDGARVTTVPATATTAAVTTPSGRHVWSVVAVDKAGNSSTAVSSVAAWFDVTAPAAAQPAPLPATQGVKAIKVSWAAAVDPESGIRGYTVVATNGTRTVKATAPGTATSATLAVPEDGSWQVDVQAVNQAGQTTDAPAGTVLVDSARPAAPVITGPVAKSTAGTSFTVTWTAPAAGRSGISGYRVAVNGKAFTTVDGTTLQAPVTVTATRAAPVTVTVTAVNGAGVVGQAATVTFTASPAA
ncbi:hypothetical protein AB0G04_08460 [Actinoplanes sp. NPDC023801]|uniref:hypothetical protein n=1 Tax=Actinoplanes sp. NPDC023801 TaxID=3154595 RepID=UPI003411E86C